MSNRIVAQAVRLLAVIGTLALCGGTSNATWAESHYVGSGDQFVPILPDRLLNLVDRDGSDPQAS